MLKGKQRRFLRALGTALDPAVQVGKAGMSPSLIESLEDALAARELVKVKILKNCFEDPKFVGQFLSESTESELVQVIGRNVLLYRPAEKKNKKIELPK